MKPSRDDIFEMVAGLMAVLGGIERAQRAGDSGTLATLRIVATRGKARPSDIAAHLGVHQSTVTRQVQALETRGYLSVTGDSEDRRSCFVALTEAGANEARRLTEIGLTRFEGLVADWEADDVQTLSRLLWKLEQSKSQLAEKEQRHGRSWQTSR